MDIANTTLTLIISIHWLESDLISTTFTLYGTNDISMISRADGAMKFTVKATASTFTGRRGVLTGFKRLPDVALDTPGCLLFTRCGSVPHLSRDVLQKIENLPSIVSMSMRWAKFRQIYFSWELINYLGVVSIAASSGGWIRYLNVLQSFHCRHCHHLATSGFYIKFTRF